MVEKVRVIPSIWSGWAARHHHSRKEMSGQVTSSGSEGRDADRSLARSRKWQRKVTEPVNGPVYEIRDYHYRSGRMDAYRDWARLATKVLGDRMDLVGFWVDVGIPGNVMGSDPMDLTHGPPNVTWIIRWENMEQRETVWDALWEDPEWSAVWADHPGYDDYLHMSVRFLTEAAKE